MNNNEILNIIREALIKELEFDTEDEFRDYTSKHKVRDSTQVKIGNKIVSAGSLSGKTKETSPSKSIKPTVRKKSKKKKSGAKKGGPVNPYFKEFGKYKLNAVPPIDVKREDIKENFEGDINSHAVLSWKDPKSGRTVNAYTKKFMERNAKIKWKRIEKLDDNDIDKVYTKSMKMLDKGNFTLQEGAAIISIIAKTGLRPGSKLGFEDTGNRGVSTLGPDNVSVDGNKITLNFVGKSYQENNAEFEDPKLAKYLKGQLKKQKGKEFLFDITNAQLQSVYKAVGKKGTKIKDMRTFMATKVAKEILYNNDNPPPPLPKTQTEIKKTIKNKLKSVFEQVSQKLNNTPAMAKSSYIHPKVIEEWLKELGVEPVLVGYK